MRILFPLLAAFIVALSLDGGSKIWAERVLVLHQPVAIIGQVFRFTLGYNTGVAFGMFSNGGPWPLIITAIVIAGLVFWFATVLRRGQLPPLAGWGIGLLLGGAMGNFIDRLPDGQVTDFLDVGLGAFRWPTFNLADSFILIGLAFLMLIEMKLSPKEPETTSQQPQDENKVAIIDD